MTYKINDKVNLKLSTDEGYQIYSGTITGIIQDEGYTFYKINASGDTSDIQHHFMDDSLVVTEEEIIAEKDKPADVVETELTKSLIHALSGKAAGKWFNIKLPFSDTDPRGSAGYKYAIWCDEDSNTDKNVQFCITSPNMNAWGRYPTQTSDWLTAAEALDQLRECKWWDHSAETTEEDQYNTTLTRAIVHAMYDELTFKFALPNYCIVSRELPRFNKDVCTTIAKYPEGLKSFNILVDFGALNSCSSETYTDDMAIGQLEQFNWWDHSVVNQEQELADLGFVAKDKRWYMHQHLTILITRHCKQNESFYEKVEWSVDLGDGIALLGSFDECKDFAQAIIDEAFAPAASADVVEYTDEDIAAIGGAE